MAAIGNVNLTMKDVAPEAIVKVTVKGCRMYEVRLWLVKCVLIAARIVAPIRVKIEVKGDKCRED